jgi:hypothetical protein
MTDLKEAVRRRLQNNQEGSVPEPVVTAEPKRVRETEQFVPFPGHLLPAKYGEFCEAVASSIGCDFCFVAVPLVVAAAAAIGTTRTIRLKAGWEEPSILWACMIGESGDRKSPPLDLILNLVRRREAAARDAFGEQSLAHERATTTHERDLSEWKRSGTGDPPAKPIPPVCERFLICDSTTEAVSMLLADQPRGLLLGRDELNGWLQSFNRYSRGSADQSFWLQCFGGRPHTVDRRSGGSLHIPATAVSIVGGIQPGILKKSLDPEFITSGLAARLLFCSPPRRTVQWTDQGVPPDLRDEAAACLDRLYDLRPAVDGDDHPRPVAMDLTADAKPLWVAFFNAHEAEQSRLTGDLAAVWAKLEAVAARLALAIELMNWSTSRDSEAPVAVGSKAVAAGIQLARWFGHEARRAYAALYEDEETRVQRQLSSWIDRRGGSVTIRDVLTGNRRFGSSAEAEAALHELAAAGLGGWEDRQAGANGGRPTRVFVSSASAQPPIFSG